MLTLSITLVSLLSEKYAKHSFNFYCLSIFVLAWNAQNWHFRKTIGKLTTPKEKKKKISFFNVTLQSVSYCTITKFTLIQGTAKQRTTCSKFCQCSAPVYIYLTFIVLIKSPFWSQVDRAVFQFVVTISFLCIYLIHTDMALIWSLICTGYGFEMTLN